MNASRCYKLKHQNRSGWFDGRAYGKAVCAKILCIVIVSQRWKEISRQMRNSICKENDRIQERVSYKG